MEWSYKRWRYWFKHSPSNLKWVLWVILVFPLFASTWEMKKVAGISPLQLLGVYVFVMTAFYSLTQPRQRNKSNAVFSFTIFGFILIINVLFIFFQDISFVNFGSSVRTILPIFLFFYFRGAITNLRDFEGFLMTFLISAIFPLSVLSYEIIFEPIKYVYNTASRGGGLRLSGFFADLFGYMSYLIGGYIAYSYFFLKGLKYGTKIRLFKPKYYAIMTLLFFIGIFNLRHQASWAVSLVIITLLAFYARSYASSIQYLVVFIIVIIAGYYFYTYVFEILYAKEINVAAGDEKQDRALNGRVWIWNKYFVYWWKFGSLSKTIGVGFSTHPIAKIMISGGMHSDYVRLFFTTGIVGAFLYLISIFNFVVSAFKKQTVEIRFIFISTIIVLLMYSISSAPLLASGALMYFILAIISFI